MESTKKIGWGQLLLLLFMCRVFTLMTFSDSVDGSLTVQTTAAVISTAVQAVLIIPIVLLKGSVTRSAMRKNRAAGTLLAVLYLLFFLFYTVNSALRFRRFLSERFFENAGSLLWLAVLLLVCAYCARLGVEALGRGGVLLFWLFAAALAVMAISSAGDFDMTNLVFGEPVSNGLFTAVMEDLSRNGEICAAAFLAGHVRDRLRCGVYGLLASKLILIELVILLITAVLGDFAAYTDYPFLTVGTFGGTGFIQRGDSLYLIVWTVTAVVNISLFLHISAGLIGEIVPNFNGGVWVSAATVFAAAACFALTDTPFPENAVFAACAVVVLVGVIPFFTLLCSKKTSTVTSK